MTRPKPQATDAAFAAAHPVHQEPHAPMVDTIAVAALAKALAHPARVQIVEILRRRSTCIGCDIVEEIGLAASTTSEHLRILKAAGLVVGEIERPRVCYSLNPAAVAPLTSFLSLVADTVPARLERRGDHNNDDTLDNTHPAHPRRSRARRAG